MMDATLERSVCRQPERIAAGSDWQCLEEAWEEKRHSPRGEWQSSERPQKPVCSHIVLLVARPAGDPWDNLPVHLQEIRDEIVRSRQLLDRCDDWDGEGSPRILDDTWRRAATFLANYAKYLWRTRRRRIDRPDITAGPGGSIDLHWDRPAYEMLINIPAHVAELAGFYVDDRSRATLKGKFAPENLDEGVIAWLLKVM